MARPPFTLDGPSGGIQILDLGRGAAVLTVVVEGEALSYALSSEEARSVARYLEPQRGQGAGANPSDEPRQPKFKRAPNGTVDYEEYARLFESDDAGNYALGGRVKYVADHFGIAEHLASSRIGRARTAGLIKGSYRVDPRGNPLGERESVGQA